MPRLNRVNKNIVTGITLGLFALGTNSVLALITNSNSTPFGNIFLFLSAIALGPLGGICSAGVGVIPYTVVVGDHLSGLRILALCLSLGYASKAFPKFPPFLVATCLWLLAFAPAYFALDAYSSLSRVISAEHTLLSALVEITFTLISSALLLSSNIWCLIARTPRHTPFSTFMIHTLSLVSVLALLGTLMTTGMVRGTTIGSLRLDSSLSLGWLAALFICMLFIPAWCGQRLAKILTGNFQEFFGADLMLTAKSKSFSGLSSDHWRRKGALSPEESANTENWQSVSSWRSEGETAESFLEHGMQGVCAIRNGGIISFANRSFAKLLGIEKSDVTNKAIHELGLDRDFCTALVALVTRTNEKGSQRSELKLKSDNGKLSFFEISTQLSKGQAENSSESVPPAVIVTLNDITRRRTIEDHLLKAQRLESIGTLVSGLVHEVNNALTAVIGKASIALKSLNNQKVVGPALTDISNVSKEAGKTLRELLEFAEEGPTEMRDLNLSEAIKERIEFLRKLVGETVEIEFETPAGPLGAHCDSKLLTQSLTNLVINAKDAYDKSGGKIVITVDTEEVDEEVSGLHMGAKAGTFVRVRVRDFGPGMNRDIFARAFDPLFTTKSGNSGIGLSIVYASMRAQDGFLTAESTPGKGTTVALYFPLKNLSDDVSTEKRATSGSYSTDIQALLGNNERILVVEDEPTVRELVASMLSELGYKVTSCSNGPEALDISKESGFDLVLVDMIMPKMRGIDLIDKIKSSRGKIRSLIMTGYNTEPNNSEQKVIHKPFDITTLARAVKSSLASEPKASTQTVERISSGEIRI